MKDLEKEEMNIALFIKPIFRKCKTNDAVVVAANIRADEAIRQNRFQATEHNCQKLASVLQVIGSDLKTYLKQVELDDKAARGAKELIWNLHWRIMMLQGRMSPIPVSATWRDLVEESDRVFDSMLTVYDTGCSKEEFDRETSDSKDTLLYIRYQLRDMWDGGRITKSDWKYVAWTYDNIVRGFQAGSYYDIVASFRQTLNEYEASKPKETSKSCAADDESKTRPEYVPGTNSVTDYLLQPEIYEHRSLNTCVEVFKWTNPDACDELERITDGMEKADAEKYQEDGFNIARELWEWDKQERNRKKREQLLQQYGDIFKECTVNGE